MAIVTPEQEKFFSASNYFTNGEGDYWDDWEEIQEWLYFNDSDSVTIYPAKRVPFKLCIEDFLRNFNVLDETPRITFYGVLETVSDEYLDNCENDYSSEELWPPLAEDKLFRAFQLFMALNRWPMALGLPPWGLWFLDCAIAKFNMAVEKSDCFAILLPDESTECVIEYEASEEWR